MKPIYQFLVTFCALFVSIDSAIPMYSRINGKIHCNQKYKGKVHNNKENNLVVPFGEKGISSYRDDADLSVVRYS